MPLYGAISPCDATFIDITLAICSVKSLGTSTMPTISPKLNEMKLLLLQKKRPKNRNYKKRMPNAE